MTPRPDAGPADPRWRLDTAPRVAREPAALDAEQQSVVDQVAAAGHGPLLVLAGPGTGKTTTIVAAVAARVATGTDPGRILTLTFSRKAAQELRSRIGTAIGRTVGAPLAWTFHGFGYSLLRHTRAADDVGTAPAMVSGPEQDVMVRDLLLGGVDVHPDRWPDHLRAALPTRGFTAELRGLLAKARSLGMEPTDLAAIDGRDDWQAAADFLREYLDVLDSRGVVDYAELVARAVAWAESPTGRATLRASYDLVVVDEYQDTDPAQERLLRAVAGDGRDLMVVGDPDQSIYAFRGATVDNILRFRERFPTASGDPAAVAVLRTCRRSGRALLDASRVVARRLPTGGAGLAEQLSQHHALQPVLGVDPGEVEALVFPTEGAQAEGIADLLRREHLRGRRPWSDMAVLVRSGITGIPPLQRVLLAHGVPVEVAGDELPLAQAPAVDPLVRALEVVASPQALTPDTALALLASPLVAADAAAVRRLGRQLREAERAAGTAPGLVPPSAQLLREALRDGRNLAAVPPDVAAPVTTLRRLLEAATGVLERGGTVHEVLWALWDGTGWQRRLVAAADRGGPASQAADRDLDAVVALFDLAARNEVRSRGRGLRSFLAELCAQQIPGDTLAERSVRRVGVRLMTAHRSKGLEWPVVVVAGVQEDGWPDLRHRGSLLQADRLTTDGLAPPVSVRALLGEERRLFYVATTRASQRLVVTAVGSDEDDGPSPSRFLDELAVEVQQVSDRPRRPLTLTALTAELRATVVDSAVPAAARQAAAARLARLADAEVSGHRLAPAADPDRWWGVLQVTEAAHPVRSLDQPLRLSGSSLQRLAECPLRWFLGHEVGAEGGRPAHLGFGSVVHAVAEGVATGAADPDLDTLMAHIDSVWRQLQFGAAWESEQQRDEARTCVGRFLAWHRQDRGRTLVGSEQAFEVELPVGGRTVLLRGRLDRVELDDAGRVVVVDFKTSKNAPTAAEVGQHLQLAVYQRAVREGAVTQRSRVSGGAELVQLRIASGSGPKVQQQAADDGSADLLDDALATAVAAVDAEDFRPLPGTHCRYCEFSRVCPAQDEGQELVR